MSQIHLVVHSPHLCLRFLSSGLDSVNIFRYVGHYLLIQTRKNPCGSLVKTLKFTVDLDGNGNVNVRFINKALLKYYLNKIVYGTFISNHDIFLVSHNTSSDKSVADLQIITNFFRFSVSRALPSLCLWLIVGNKGRALAVPNFVR